MTTATARRPVWWNHAGCWGAAGFCAYVSILVVTRPVVPGGLDLGFRGQLFGVAALVFCGLLFPGATLARVATGHRRSSLVFHLFWLAVLALTPFARAPAFALAYVGLTFLVYAVAGNLWSAPRRWRQASLGVVTLVCFGFCVSVAVTNPLNPGRMIGVLTPNHFAAIALTPTLLSFVWRGTARAVVQVVSLALILYVSARGALLAWMLFVVVHETAVIWIHRRWHVLVRAALVGGLLLPVAGVLLLAWPAARDTVATALAQRLALTDPDRGVGSGFTGRYEIWSEHRDEIADHFVAGIGFRGSRTDTVMGSTHNAYLDLVKETGVIGTGLFLLFVGLRLLVLVRAVVSPDVGRESAQVSAGVLAGLVAILFLAFFEALLLNIGFPIGACALLFYSFHEPAPAPLPVRSAVPHDRAGTMPAGEVPWPA